MTDMNDLVNLLGRYFGEPEIAQFLSDFNITAVPKLKRGDITVTVSNKESGIEATFRDADALDVQTREYPEGALVLSNVRFYGVETDDFAPYTGPLPLGVTFGASKQKLIDRLGAPARDNLRLRQVRWDFETYCVFARFGDTDDMIIFGIQLPVE